MRGLVIVAWQSLTFWVFGIPLRWWFRVKTGGWSGVPLPGMVYIFASNHPTRLDPFLVSYGIPWRLAWRLFPVRFATAPKYLDAWWKKVLLLPFGCVSLESKNGQKVTERLASILQKGENLFLFPSGRLEKGEEKINPKVGVVYLEKEVKNALILPVRIIIEGPFTWSGILCRKVCVNIHIMAPFRHTHFQSDLQPLAWDVVRRIKNGALNPECQSTSREKRI